MAYDWPPGWNETRTEKAVQHYICDTLNVPKYAVRCSIDSDVEKPFPGDAQPIVQIFKPLTGKRTADVHEVFARLVAFAEHFLRVDVPEEQVDERTFTTRAVYVWPVD